MKKFAALLIALVIVLSAVCVAEGTTFKMGIDPDFPPYSYVGDNGDYTGFDVDMCTAVCEKLGWDLEIVPINWDTKLLSLDAGEIDCIWSGLTIDVLDPEAYTLSFAYATSDQRIMTTVSSGITSLADLAGKVVGVQSGTSADIMLQGDQAELAATFAELKSFTDYNTCFTELRFGGTDAIAIDASTGNNLIAANGEEYILLDDVLANESYGICFRKDDAEMCSAIEGAIMELVADGTYIELGNAYADKELDVTALTLKAE